MTDLVSKEAVLALVERRRQEAGERYCRHQDQMDMEIVNEMDTIERLVTDLPAGQGEAEKLASLALEVTTMFALGGGNFKLMAELEEAALATQAALNREGDSEG